MGTNLKDVLESRKKSEIIKKEDLIFSNEIYNQEKGEYLKEKSFELALISAKGALALGKLFEEVYQELKDEKTYVKWVEINNFHRATAWRYRQKYNLYLEVNSNAKSLVAILPFKLISDIYANEESDKIINLLNEGISRKELEELLLTPQIEQKEIDNQEEKEQKKEALLEQEFFGDFQILEKEISIKFPTLSTKKKLQVKKLTEKIKKILG